MQASAQWIAEAVSGRVVGNDVPVTGPVVTDSREAQAGSLYVARRGESADGHAFVSGAVERGAVAVIVEHEVDEAVAQIVVEDSTEALTLANIVLSVAGHVDVSQLFEGETLPPSQGGGNSVFECHLRLRSR